jgi:hypothetical protein
MAEAGQEVAPQANAAALRAFLAGAAHVRPEITKVLKSVQSLFAGLQADKLLAVKPVGALGLRVSAGSPVVTLRGGARRQGTSIVPCIVFRVDDRVAPVRMLLAPTHTAWSWAESAGLGVDGKAVDADSTCKVFLALLAGEV